MGGKFKEKIMAMSGNIDSSIGDHFRADFHVTCSTRVIHPLHFDLGTLLKDEKRQTNKQINTSQKQASQQATKQKKTKHRTAS